MFNEIGDYQKCQVANKFTLGGYLLMGASLPLGIAEYQTELIPLMTSLPTAFSGWAIAALTDYGKDTFHKYKQAKEHIRTFDDLPEVFVKETSKNYCHRKGVELAIKESGLENRIKSRPHD